MTREIITIAGSLGSGKSSTAKAVALALSYRHFSSGDLFRQIAAERGESIEAINLSAEVQKDIDYRVDELLQEMYHNDTKLVIDSRMAWHWMPESFKVFLSLDADTAAHRIFDHVQKEGRVSENATSVDDVRASIERRFASEQKRYFSLYGVNATDPANFDLVINTKENDLKTVIAMVLSAYDAKRQ
ncbi:MAG: putative cytidylate kinase [Candidatus Kaiserbacteria bacterium]|nr:putative cytidylate kinase [Candidatus Kaiserbacteria bacterium]